MSKRAGKGASEAMGKGRAELLRPKATDTDQDKTSVVLSPDRLPKAVHKSEPRYRKSVRNPSRRRHIKELAGTQLSSPERITF